MYVVLKAGKFTINFNFEIVLNPLKIGSCTLLAACQHRNSEKKTLGVFNVILFFKQQIPVVSQQQQPQKAFTGYAQAVISGHSNKNNNRHTQQQPQQQSTGASHQSVSTTSYSVHNIASSTTTPAFTSQSSSQAHHISTVQHHYPQQTQHNQSHSKHSGGSVKANTDKGKRHNSNTITASGDNISTASSINSKDNCWSGRRKDELLKGMAGGSRKAVNGSSGDGKIEEGMSTTMVTHSSSDQLPATTTTHKSEGEDLDGATGSKPKRKRNRRRRKKSKSDANNSESQGGGVSDGPYELHRAHSSSNVSRTSTMDNEILHFEDEDEFPNLLSAVGGLSDGNSANNQASLSYSDILKGQQQNYHSHVGAF